MSRVATGRSMPSPLGIEAMQVPPTHLESSVHWSPSLLCWRKLLVGSLAGTDGMLVIPPPVSPTSPVHTLVASAPFIAGAPRKSPPAGPVPPVEPWQLDAPQFWLNTGITSALKVTSGVMRSVPA